MQPVELTFSYTREPSPRITHITGELQRFEIDIQTDSSTCYLKIVNVNVDFDFSDNRSDGDLSSVSKLKRCIVLSPEVCVYYLGASKMVFIIDAGFNESEVEVNLVGCKFYKDLESAKVALVTKELMK